MENVLTEKEIDQLLSALSEGEIEIDEINKNNKDNKAQYTLSQSEVDALIEFYENAKKTGQNSASVLSNITLNSFIKVKLTHLGRDIYYHKDDEFIEYAEKMGMPGIQREYPKVDADGYTKFMLKAFMSIFGKYAHKDIIKGNIEFVPTKRKDNNFYERICTYCQYRHDLYCNNEKAHKAFETRDCPEFILGKCFSCSVRKSNNNRFVDGICQSFDYEGCINFKE